MRVTTLCLSFPTYRMNTLTVPAHRVILRIELLYL